MELISARLGKIKNLLDARTDFVDEMREIIFQVSGVDLTVAEVVWQAPTLIIKAPPVARNLVLRHREKILTLLADRFDRLAPRMIR